MLRTSSLTAYGRCITLSFLLIALLTMLSSCAENISPSSIVTPTPTSASSIPTLPITAVNYGYIMPNTITVRSGLVDIAMVNNGSEAHQAQVARLNAGVTRDEVIDRLITKKDQAAAFSLLTFAGGPDTVSPGYGQEAILNLTTGQYVLLCFVVGQDGIPHINKGMIHFFAVSSGLSQQTTPQADGKVIMKDFTYDLPAVITQSRSLTLQVTNQGSEPHEMNIVELEKGKSIQDIASFFQLPSGPPPFEELGGLAAIAPHASGWIKIQLEPGNYALFSILPDERTGKSQLSLGMITPFTVQ
jgi:hypothetical protein